MIINVIKDPGSVSDTGIYEFLLDIEAHKGNKIRTSHLFGYVYTEKDYILQDCLVVENYLSYSVFLNLKDKKDTFILEIPNIFKVESSLLPLNAMKYWLHCRNEHMYRELQDYIDYTKRNRA